MFCLRTNSTLLMMKNVSSFKTILLNDSQQQNPIVFGIVRQLHFQNNNLLNPPTTKKSINKNQNNKNKRIENYFQTFIVRNKHITAIQNSPQSTTLSVPVEAAATNPIEAKKSIESDDKTLNKYQRLPENIRFRRCPGATLTTLPDGTSPRPLVLLFGWMLSKEEHLEKYRQYWFENGYDVLSVRTLPLQLMFPYFGGRVNAQRMYDFLRTHTAIYDEILVHAFSVGGYQLSEFINVIDENEKLNDLNAKQMSKAVKGIIIDSCVFYQDAAPGLSRAITLHPTFQPMLQFSLQVFFALTKPFVMDRYARVQSLMMHNERRIPGLVVCSKKDVVSNMSTNKQMYLIWKQKTNNLADYHCFEKSKHVLHYKDYPDQYLELVNNFVKKIDIKKGKHNKKQQQVYH